MLQTVCLLHGCSLTLIHSGKWNTCGMWAEDIRHLHDMSPHYSSAASTSLASGSPANHLQVSRDHVQVPPWSGAVLLGWCVYSSFICHRQVAASVGWQRDTRRAAHQDHDRSERLRRADFITVHRDICEEAQNSSVQLQAHLRSPSKWCYTNSHIHSFKLPSAAKEQTVSLPSRQ